MRRLPSDSCGCAMGAWFLGICLAVSIAWYGWHWHAFALSVWGISWRIMAFSFGGAVLGKLLGMLQFRMANSM